MTQIVWLVFILIYVNSAGTQYNGGIYNIVLVVAEGVASQGGVNDLELSLMLLSSESPCFN